MPQYARCRDYGDGSQEKHRQKEGMIGIAAWTARNGDGGDPDGGGRDDQAAACLDGRPGQRPAGARAGGREMSPTSRIAPGMSARSAARSA